MASAHAPGMRYTRGTGPGASKLNTNPTPLTGAAARLVATLRECESRAAQGALSLGEVLDSIREAGYAFICIVLVLPFLQPFSLGPLAVAGGLTFAALGWQYLRGHPAPVLPERLRRTVMTAKTWRLMLETCVKLVGWCSRFSRPRRAELVSGETGRRNVGLIMIAGGLLMAIPMFGLPLNNLLPALSIFFICVGQLEQDGLMVWVAIGWLLVTLLYFAAVLAAAWLLGTQAIAFLH